MVASAKRGKRGQRLLRELLHALDSMPWWRKKLIANELEEKGKYCALGVLGKQRGVKMKDIDPEDSDRVGEAFDIAPCLAQEIVYMNDEQFGNYTPKERWREMRNWVEKQIIKPKAQ